MSIVSEDGSGVAGAEMYGTVAQIDAYWSARPHDYRSAKWAALQPSSKEGAARSATDWLDAQYATRYLGQRKSYQQGLEWPRVSGVDADGNDIPLKDMNGVELPDLPQRLASAVAEIAVAMIDGVIQGGTLATYSMQANVKRFTTGDVTTEFADGASVAGAVGNHITAMIASLLGNGGGIGSWDWR